MKKQAGNLELGRDNQGSHGTPGSQAYNSAVSYYLTPSGDVRVVIDNRYGSNQGYIEWHGGDVTRMYGADLDEAIQLAQEHVESLDDVEMTRAWRIASSEARATMRAAIRRWWLNERNLKIPRRNRAARRKGGDGKIQGANKGASPRCCDGAMEREYAAGKEHRKTARGKDAQHRTIQTSGPRERMKTEKKRQKHDND